MSRSENLFVFTAAVKDFHLFLSKWIPREEEKLTCYHEKNSVFDVYTMKVVTEINQFVDHFPREISRITKFLA